MSDLVLGHFLGEDQILLHSLEAIKSEAILSCLTRQLD